jgi:hypothetical protein
MHFAHAVCDLTAAPSSVQAAYYLDIEALVDLTSQALADRLALPRGWLPTATAGARPEDEEVGPRRALSLTS